MTERQMKEYRKTAKAVVQKKWCLGRAKAYLEKSVADNHAGTYGAHPTIPLLTEWVSCEPVRGEDMAVEWQDYAPAPLVRIEVWPPDKQAKHCRRVEPRAVCGDRPRDVIPQVLGAEALALSPPFSGDDEMGVESSTSVDPQPGLGASAPALLLAPPPLPAAAAAAAPAARPAAKARGKARGKERAKSHPRALGMQLGCSKCRWTSCSECQCPLCVEAAPRCPRGSGSMIIMANR